MTVTFLSLPSKHTMSTKPQPPPIPAGHVSLRILCHASHVGLFIGKSGSSIKPLQLQTGSKIRVEDSPQPGSDHRIILIVGPTSPPFKRVKLHGCPSDVEVSAVQECALRVFEKLLEVSKGGGDGDTVSFRMVIDGSEAGCVIGRGGKTVEMLKRESGAKIRVLLADYLPSSVFPPDQIVEIEGDLLAVKKGLLGVCGCLQQCSQGDKSSNNERKHMESISQPSPHNIHVDPPFPRAPLYAATTSSGPAIVAKPLSFEEQQKQSMTTISNSPMVMRPLSFEVDRPSTTELKPELQEVVFKILCSNDRIGCIIGRGGSIVQALQEESGAHISIGPPFTNCDERVVTVISKEDINSRCSPAQRAVVLIFSRSSEATAVKLHTGSNKGSSMSARLLVPSNQVGCLLGKGGGIVSEMRKATGTFIHIYKGEQVPKCASGDDQVVEIRGQFVNIQDALYQVTSRLRSNLFPRNMTSVSRSQTNTSLTVAANHYERVRELPVGVHHSFAASQSFDGLSIMRQGLDSLNISQRMDHTPLSGSRTSEVALGVNSRSCVNFGRDLGAANGGVEFNSGPAIVKNTTVEILIPEDAISSVYGENERNLTRIRQISGAKVTVNEPSPGTKNRTVLISGTPSETQAAQSLLHAFILTGSS
ncbi:KH domain-containing protein HEN4-like [Silene latifolia]|uniref:KH domain-containing protein HEN4-like n=1 Tax=Silene latifolia TaxID=37657 RepID=UPI003D777E9E